MSYRICAFCLFPTLKGNSKPTEKKSIHCSGFRLGRPKYMECIMILSFGLLAK